VDYAEKVPIVGGVLNLGYAAITGVIISRIRSGSPTVPRHLTLAHIGPLMEGSMLLALVVAFTLASLPSGLAGLTAWLLVGGSFSIAAGNTILWRTDAVDAFAEKQPGFYLQAIGGAVTALGLAISIIGVLKGL
jgi:hypothetical protein